MRKLFLVLLLIAIASAASRHTLSTSVPAPKSNLVQESASSKETVIVAKDGQKANEVLSGVGKEHQTDAFRRVIISTGGQCGKITKIFFKGQNKTDNSAYYAIRCSPGGDWMVSVSNDGNMSTRVVSCAVLKAINVKCWDAF